ncbi:hypothetical protein G5B38_14310 [Pseudohalocynthiibacter aestuariivivens]|uniref:Beta-barrel assembly machine subunit BamE n=1 Tax=Roseovarius pelagicus TaxID=2980108 RepID=A0ABY6DFD7_9RHOB|nr:MULTISPECIES: hypothetical protein [Rhodobacterales]QIE46601.1 hypothetical protein G5B38_14310 [Pseudohalocynthiibacter aestuariivivens]UXX84872.1 hypothetical protein N7U68_09630 [Roseovarius pelagicus]
MFRVFGVPIGIGICLAVSACGITRDTQVIEVDGTHYLITRVSTQTSAITDVDYEFTVKGRAVFCETIEDCANRIARLPRADKEALLASPPVLQRAPGPTPDPITTVFAPPAAPQTTPGPVSRPTSPPEVEGGE